MVRENPCEFIKSVDMYGPEPTFTFKRHKNFRTWVGACFTIFAVLLFLSFSLSRTLRLINGEDPFLSMITLPDDHESAIDLVKLSYRFGITKVDASHGRIEAKYVIWPKG